MDTHLNLQWAIERAAEGYKLSALQKISNEITKRYKTERGNGAKLVTSKEEALVYTIVRMPATYSAVHSALSHILQYVSDDIFTLLDVGAGTGAATWAALDLVKLSTVDCIEREKQMIALGKQLMTDCDFPVCWIESDLAHLSEKKYDLVIASYALNELSPVTRKAALDRLWQCTEKVLLIVEPGTPYAFQLQKEMRTHLTKKGAILAAPCPQGASCQLPANDWCHFACRVQRSKLHREVKGADSPFEDEKFTYSAFLKNTSERGCARRILRHPLIQEKKITLTVCSKEGIGQTVFFKKDQLYKKVKKLKAGDEY